jgi:transcriptional regulator with XRE-family HTH domain
MPGTRPPYSAIQREQLRGAAGHWLRGLRQQRGLSQRGLARKVGAKFTFISQIENGHCRLPPYRYLIWAEALEVDPREFVQEMLAYDDPLTYGTIFAAEPLRAV